MKKNNNKFDWTKPLSTHEILHQAFKEAEEQWKREEKEYRRTHLNSHTL